MSDFPGWCTQADQIPQSTAETLTWTNTLKLSVAGGGGGPEEFKSFTRCQHDSSAHKGSSFLGQIALLSHKLQLPCYLRHSTGRIFRMLAQKAETEKLCLVDWNWFWWWKKECSKARPFGITAKSINYSTASDQGLRSHLDFAEPLQGKKLTAALDDSTHP